MILTKEVKITVANSNIKLLLNLGYTNLKCRQKIIIPIENLYKGSGYSILAKCDFCGKEKNIRYRDYIKILGEENRYYCRKCAQNKIKRTNLSRYGVECPAKNEEIKQKSKKTNLNKYGVEHFSKTEKYKKRFKKTNLERYGVEHPSQNKEIRQKNKKTNLERYGAEHPMQNEIIAKKTKQTNLKKYGVECVSKNTEIYNKIKKTNLKKYGVECPLQSKEIREKCKKTNLKRYGAESSNQNLEIHNKQQKSALKRVLHEPTRLWYQGTYEKHFLDFCFENNIPVKKGKAIKYYFDDKKRVYFSDFYLESKNLIIEIKSSYYYKKHLKKNLVKKKACIEQGYKFVFIIDKDYEKLKRLLIKL